MVSQFMWALENCQFSTSQNWMNDFRYQFVPKTDIDNYMNPYLSYAETSILVFFNWKQGTYTTQKYLISICYPLGCMVRAKKRLSMMKRSLEVFNKRMSSFLWPSSLNLFIITPFPLCWPNEEIFRDFLIIVHPKFLLYFQSIHVRFYFFIKKTIPTMVLLSLYFIFNYFWITM